MQIQIQDGYIIGYATVGGFPDGVEVADDFLTANNIDSSHLSCYKYADGVAVLDNAKLEGQTASAALDEIRYKREIECFEIVDRSPLWHDSLTDEQRADLAAWYEAWLDAPETGVIPDKPTWL